MLVGVFFHIRRNKLRRIQVLTLFKIAILLSRGALQVVMMFVPASSRYLPLIQCAIRQYAAAMFKILYFYGGWQCGNHVLNEVTNPIRTIKIADPLVLGITSALYIFANIANFAYVRSSLHLLDQRRFPIVINTAHRQRQTF